MLATALLPRGEINLAKIKRRTLQWTGYQAGFKSLQHDSHSMVKWKPVALWRFSIKTRGFPQETVGGKPARSGSISTRDQFSR